ncbi:MAG: hypothetical protein ABSG91_15290 [Syntrophobacteraceae bacterium]|jgi:hypothetical protein
MGLVLPNGNQKRQPEAATRNGNQKRQNAAVKRKKEFNGWMGKTN